MRTVGERFDRWLVASVAFHAGIVLCVFVAPSLFIARSATWGTNAGGNGGVNVKIVSHVSGIALPSPEVTAEDAAASENKSLHENEPEQKVKPQQKPDPAAVQLPSKNAPKEAKKPAPATPPQPVKTASAAPQTPPSNAVPYGARGGSPALRYGQTATGTGPTGADFGGDGTFGDKYGTYVDAMTRAITDAWRGTNVTQQRAPRVYVIFTIDRDGTVRDVGLQQQTNNTSTVERAALQAVRSAKLPPLPSDYHGPPVTVRFYFDYAQ